MRRKDFLLNTGMSSLMFVPGFKGIVSVIKSRDENFKGINSSVDIPANSIHLETPHFDLLLDKDSQTLISLVPKSASGFDFLPADRYAKRIGDQFYNLGDITLRLRFTDETGWKSYSSAFAKAPVQSPDASAHPDVLAAADLSPTFASDIPLTVLRYWKLDGDDLVLSFDFENKTDKEVEIGALGIPMVFNNIITDRNLTDAHHKCSFCDPYIGLDAGYVQVTRLNGAGPALLIVPENNSPLEAYKLLHGDKTGRSLTFEGFYNWMVHSKAYAENEWKDAEQWNESSSAVLKPGDKKNYSIKFLAAPQIREIENTLIKHGRPVAVGIPGYVIPSDQEALLFLNYRQPVQSVSVYPSDAMSIKRRQSNKNGWQEYDVRGRKWGRARVTVTYRDGLVQTINYKTINPERKVLAGLGSFIFTKQWFKNDEDMFGRSPSPITYDYFLQKQVTQEKRVWIAGLSDEGGNGTWVAAIMKQLILPDKKEIDLIQKFVEKVLDGGIQYNSGEQEFGVRKSMFFYEPDKEPKGTYETDVKFGGWESWSEKEARSTGRSFNYTPVAAAFWVLYRLARNYEGLVTNHSWDWYLRRAHRTVLAMRKYARYYTQFGQMEGTVFVLLLNDLKNEGWNREADEYENMIRERVAHWETLDFPFGSEMPWDSTGQEEVYAWCHYFGKKDKANITLNAITGYMPTVPHWGYNGNARRYWDFLYAGKLQRIERQIHHYGSGLNAIPVLTEYRDNPDDFYLLRVGYGGLMGAVSNITQEGFGPCAFHSFPETLKIDSYSGDYGPNFLGHVINTGTYIVKHPQFGWLTFGGNQHIEKSQVKIVPLESSCARVYLAPKGLWLTLDSGNFKSIEFDEEIKKIKLTLNDLSGFAANARLHIEQPGVTGGKVSYQPEESYSQERGAFVIPLKGKDIPVSLTVR